MLGSQLAMPILVINMGGEMIYILQQRLMAQNIADEKARKVLEDVIKTMYTPVFLEELFKPQEMYSNSSTKQIFDKLAHSSIMRLNKQSMEKLYDLMTMGVKYQLLSCTCPQQYLHVTLAHLDALVEIVKSEHVKPLIQAAISRSIHIYTQLSQANWLLLQQTLFQFFQGKKVKVSLFLQQQVQTITGTLVLTNEGVLPFNIETPGKIRYLEDGRVVNMSHFHSDLERKCEETTTILNFQSTMGKNMYVREDENAARISRRVSATVQEAEDAFERVLGTKMEGLVTATPKPFTDPFSQSPSKPTSQASAKAELTLLADLLGVNEESAKGSKDDKSLHFDLVTSRQFKDDEEEYVDDKSSGDPSFIMIDIDGTMGAKTVESYMRDLDLKDDEDSRADGKTGQSEEDDLLALMDSAK
jgi:hypothetical protein